MTVHDVSHKLCRRHGTPPTSYITKHERCEQDRLWEDIHSASKSLGSNAMSFTLKAADRLLGHKLVSKSRFMRFPNRCISEQAKTVLKPLAELKKQQKNNPDSSNIFYPLWVLDVYPDRPDELDSMSLHDFLSHYKREVAGSHNQMKL